jgi:hypothetical protein
VPIGGTVVWWDDTLPAEGGWAWANGQVIASANTVCYPVLACTLGQQVRRQWHHDDGRPRYAGSLPCRQEHDGLHHDARAHHELCGHHRLVASSARACICSRPAKCRRITTRQLMRTGTTTRSINLQRWNAAPSAFRHLYRDGNPVTINNGVANIQRQVVVEARQRLQATGSSAAFHSGKSLSRQRKNHLGAGHVSL